MRSNHDPHRDSVKDGDIIIVDYMFPRPNSTIPVTKQSFIEGFGDIACGVGYYVVRKRLECGHSGARALPASPESKNTALRNQWLGGCPWVPGLAPRAIPERQRSFSAPC